jgi:predicted RNA-binding protein YlqC (UPF0109 family)
MAGVWETGKSGWCSVDCVQFMKFLFQPWLAVCQGWDHRFRTMQAMTDRLKNFLQYVAVNLIDEPGQAQLKVAELGPKRLRFKLILAKPDVAMLIGRNGFTASAVRGVLKAAAEREGVQVSLLIHSQEEEAELLAREAAQ